MRASRNNSRHHLSLRRELEDTFLGAGNRLLVVFKTNSLSSEVSSNLLGEDLERDLSRGSNSSGLFFLSEDLRVIVERADRGELIEDIRMLLVNRNGLLDVVLDGVLRRGTEVSELNSGHLVESESSSLIRADDGGATEGLNGRKRSDNSVVLSHLFGSESQTRGDNSGESFRDGGNGKSNSNLEIVDASSHPTSVDWVREVSEVHHPNEKTDDSNGIRKLLTELVELLLKRSIFGIDGSGLNLLLDSSNGSIHSSVNNNTSSNSVSNNGGREEHVLSVLEEISSRSDLLGLLVNSNGLSGKGSLFNLERNRNQISNSGVGGDLVTNRDLNNVSRNKVLRVDDSPFSVSEDL